MTTAKSAPAEFLDQQVALLEAGDTVGLSNRYHEDATFVRFDRIAHGRAEVKELFDAYIAEGPEIVSMDALQMTDDLIFYQAAERVSGKLTTAVGTLAFRDGLVWRQTVAFVPERPEGGFSA